MDEENDGKRKKWKNTMEGNLSVQTKMKMNYKTEDEKNRKKVLNVGVHVKKK